MESILQFIYLGKASFFQERMKEFLGVGKDLQIKEIKDVPKEENNECIEQNTENEILDMDSHLAIGIVKNEAKVDEAKLNHFLSRINKMRVDKTWTKDEIIHLFHEMIPNFGHQEMHKYLDSKM